MVPVCCVLLAGSVLASSNSYRGNDMLTVWKYPMNLELEMELPKGAKVLTVRKEEGQRNMWVLVDPSVLTLERRTFLVVSTGNTIEESMQDLSYVDTFFESGFVMHLFEVSNHE